MDSGDGELPKTVMFVLHLKTAVPKKMELPSPFPGLFKGCGPYVFRFQYKGRDCPVLAERTVEGKYVLNTGWELFASVVCGAHQNTMLIFSHLGGLRFNVRKLDRDSECSAASNSTVFNTPRGVIRQVLSYGGQSRRVIYLSDDGAGQIIIGGLTSIITADSDAVVEGDDNVNESDSINVGDRADEDELNEPTDTISFTLTLNRSHFDRVDIPSSFVEEAGLRRHNMLVLSPPRPNLLMEVELFHSGRHSCWSGIDWTYFCRKNKLSIGDRIRFRLKVEFGFCDIPIVGVAYIPQIDSNRRPF